METATLFSYGEFMLASPEGGARWIHWKRWWPNSLRLWDNGMEILPGTPEADSVFEYYWTVVGVGIWEE